jgi:TonB family protein
MYLDFDEHRPETPRIGSPITIREGVLLSLVVHLLFVIFLLVAPDELFEPDPVETLAQAEPSDRQPLRFIEVLPLVDRSAPTERPADASDIDRRSATRERAPIPDNPLPFSRGNTPERVEGGPTEPAGRPEPPAPPAPPSPEPPSTPDESVLPPLFDESARAAAEQPRPEARPPGSLGQALRNLQRYLREDNYENAAGGQTDYSSDFQFDSKGVEFGPWLLRFKRQVERNWIVPPAAYSYRGRVAIQFNVHRNGAITDLNVVLPARVPALTQAALSALKASNPTARLPDEYPGDKVFFTVTFHYNEYPGDYR